MVSPILFYFVYLVFVAGAIFAVIKVVEVGAPNPTVRRIARWLLDNGQAALGVIAARFGGMFLKAGFFVAACVLWFMAFKFVWEEVLAMGGPQ